VQSHVEHQQSLHALHSRIPHLKLSRYSYSRLIRATLPW